MRAPVIGENLLREADRVADRLRLVLPRLLNREDDGPGRALLARTLAVLQSLADSGAGAQGRAERPVPEIAVHAVPDQLIVLAHDLVAGAPEPGAFAGDAASRAALEQAIADGLAALQELRSRL